MTEKGYFTEETFRFLSDLAENNDRDWFEENRHRYTEHVKEAALRFIFDFGPRLKAISPHFQATPRSLFRIHRDVRFSPDKSPYKTHVGVQFRHDAGPDAHAPGFYLHVEPEGCFAALGMWHPGSEALASVRRAIVERTDAWREAVDDEDFRSTFELQGDRLKRGPRDYPADHPLIEDLKWKDFVGVRGLGRKVVLSPALPTELATLYRAGAPFVRFLCQAVEVPF